MDLKTFVNQMFTPGTVPCTLFGMALGIIFAVLCLTIGVGAALLIALFCLIGAFVGGVKEHAEELDSEISACLRGWTLARLSRVDLAIMRLAVYEMQYTGLPAAVAINEAVELTRKYSGEESCPFVNGVLGSISRKLAAQA